MQRTLSSLGISLLLLVAGWGTRAAGQDLGLANPFGETFGNGRLSLLKTTDKHRIVEAPKASPVRLVGEAHGMRAYTLSEEDRESVQGMALEAFSNATAKRGDGGGGDVSEFLIIQTTFLDSQCPFPEQCGGPCNVVLMLWTENLENPQGVNIIVNGNLLGTLPGLGAQELPGTNGVNIQGVPAGVHTFRAEDPSSGSTAECTIEVLDSQPFKDVSDLKCEQGLVAEDGTCEVVVTWVNAGPFADELLVLFDGNFIGTVPGANLGVAITGVSAGEHCVDIVGIKLFNDCAVYRGCFVRTCCTVTCERPLCTPPQALILCQTAYGPNPENNFIQAAWTNGENPYAVGVNAILDDVPLGTLPGDTQLAFINTLAVGPHKVGIQGDCGPPNGTSAIAEATITILDASPHPMPITEDGIVCTFQPDPDGGGEESSSTTATWTLKDPSLFIDVYVIVAPDLFLLGTIAGNSTTVTVTNTAETDRIALQFFANVNGNCYGSPLLACDPPPPATNSYIQGMCNGVGESPQISSAVYFLNFLFLGGTEPPCIKACDANGDGLGNLSDAVYVLSYLFLGGPAPTLWVDSDGDGSPDATCTRAAPEDDCKASHPPCAPAG